MFKTPHNIEEITICPNHRSVLGVGWSRGSNTRCRIPKEVSSVLENLEDGAKKDQIKYQFEQSKNKIGAWKAHILRCINQDQARLDILKNLGPLCTLGSRLGHEVSAQNVSRGTDRVIGLENMVSAGT
ncbi:Hypothetical predicted protein [Paramuricea clavata]|uniref:Uncharacterized protein n=1 Tax=Paramuricea clavata TaxID=317549 RepID=A0A6S7I3G2_PARCT|nr:Hypothetical predicted protein [Paramuricea clavata]